MNPAAFPECNSRYKAPVGLDESQCMTIPAYQGVVRGGSVDGSQIVVVAWQPTPEEVQQIAEGAPIYISMMGGLAPHFPTTNFQSAINPT